MNDDIFGVFHSRKLLEEKKIRIAIRYISVVSVSSPSPSPASLYSSETAPSPGHVFAP